MHTTNTEHVHTSYTIRHKDVKCCRNGYTNHLLLVIRQHHKCESICCMQDPRRPQLGKFETARVRNVISNVRSFNYEKTNRMFCEGNDSARAARLSSQLGCVTVQALVNGFWLN